MCLCPLACRWKLKAVDVLPGRQILSGVSNLLVIGACCDSAPDLPWLLFHSWLSQNSWGGADAPGQGVGVERSCSLHWALQKTTPARLLSSPVEDNRKMGVICAHIPHHATMDETSIILADMANSAAMRQDKSCSSAWTRTKFSPTPTGAHGQRRDHLGMVHGQLDQVP